MIVTITSCAPVRALRKPGDEPGDRPARRTGEDHQRHVQRERQVHAEADVGRGDGTGDELALAADVEHPGREAERDTGAGEDQRRRGHQRLRDRGEQRRPAVAGRHRMTQRGRAEDRAGEQVAVRRPDGPRSSALNACHGMRAEVAPGVQRRPASVTMMRIAPNTSPQNTARKVTTATLASVIWCEAVDHQGGEPVGLAGWSVPAGADSAGVAVIAAAPRRCSPGVVTAAHRPRSSAPAIISPIRSRPTLGGDDADDRPAEHHRDPVGEREDLVELGGDQQHGGAPVALLDDPPVDVLDRADVQPAGRLGGDQQPDRPGQLAGDDDLLLVAAGQRADRRLHRGRPDVELARACAGRCRCTSLEVPRAVPGVRREVVQVEHQVVGDRHVEHQALELAVLGDVGDPGPQRLPGRRRR